MLNFPAFEAIPAGLLQGRSNATARALARADWLLRDKSDGRYLAVCRAGRIEALLPQRWRAGLGRLTGPAVLRCLARGRVPCAGMDGATASLRRIWRELGISTGYGSERGLALVPEPGRLQLAGRDRYQRPLWLTPATSRAWQAMRAAAASEAVQLEAISGYRSHAYQAGIFRRKRARGVALEQILRVNAAPGYSEHHSGRALDIGTPGEPAAEEGFEQTPAFAWLRQRAADFGFVMSYPRDNPHAIAYEPWHWCFSS